MSDLTHVNIPTKLFVLPLKGVYEMSVAALIYNFDRQGLTISNGRLAKVFKTDVRTVERVISRLRKNGIIEDAGSGKNDRRLRFSTGIMSAIHTDTMPGKIPASGGVSTDMTADHKEEVKNKTLTEYWNSKGNLPVIRAFTEKRKKKLDLRMKEKLFTEHWQNIIDKISSSSFCTGNNNRGWKVDIDWILENSTNYIKVLEGKYDDIKKPSKTQAKKEKDRPFTPEVENELLSNMTAPASEDQLEQLEMEGLV